MKKLVSVIIPTYNSGDLLAKAVDSALAQSYGDIEVIVVDDGSTDDTNAYLAGMQARDSRIRTVIFDSNQGISRARNAGIAAARGSLIAFLDADDIWLPDKIARQVEVLSADPAAGWSYCNGFIVDHDLRVMNLLSDRRPFPEGMIYQYLLLKHPLILSSGVLLKQEVFDECGLFDPDIWGVEDWEFFLRLAGRYMPVYIPEPLFKYRIHEGNLSRQAASMEAGYGRALRKLSAMHLELAGVLCYNYHRTIGFSWLLTEERKNARRHFWAAIKFRKSGCLPWIGLLLAVMPARLLKMIIGAKKRFIRRSLSA